MIEIYLWEQLAAVARCGTLSRAAEELHISQPALSRSMKKLESDLGVSLFERINTKITLNETGKMAAELGSALLTQNDDIINRIVSFDRSQRNITFSSCAPYPIVRIMPILQEHFGNLIISSELTDNEGIITGLKNRKYQIGAVSKNPDDDEIFCQHFVDERLYITVPDSHRLSKHNEIHFSDLDGESVLMQQHVGFWHNILNTITAKINFLTQSRGAALDELIEATQFPFFNSDRMIDMGYSLPDRVNIPIADDEAYVSFYIACLDIDKKKYSEFFNSIRSESINDMI